VNPTNIFDFSPYLPGLGLGLGRHNSSSAANPDQLFSSPTMSATANSGATLEPAAKRQRTGPVVPHFATAQTRDSTELQNEIDGMWVRLRAAQRQLRNVKNYEQYRQWKNEHATEQILAEVNSTLKLGERNDSARLAYLHHGQTAMAELDFGWGTGLQSGVMHSADMSGGNGFDTMRHSELRSPSQYEYVGHSDSDGHSSHGWLDTEVVCIAAEAKAVELRSMFAGDLPSGKILMLVTVGESDVAEYAAMVVPSA
tara:strand:- start:1110 stop:1874 length:765 start_codon:yes stop_codon:yes gene_type:complete